MRRCVGHGCLAQVFETFASTCCGVLILPAGAYSHTHNVPWMPEVPGAGQVAIAQPTRIVDFQTTCVKWPVAVPEQLEPV